MIIDPQDTTMHHSPRPRLEASVEPMSETDASVFYAEESIIKTGLLLFSET